MALDAEAFAVVAPPALHVARPSCSRARAPPEAPPARGVLPVVAAAAAALAAGTAARRRTTRLPTAVVRRAAEPLDAAKEADDPPAEPNPDEEFVQLRTAPMMTTGEEPTDEGEKEEDEVDRLMGLEALQIVRKEAMPPPARCADFKKPGVEELPICGMRQEIQEMIAKNRVSIIVGGTGCGKSTQVPQFIIKEAAQSQTPCNVMVTQPRRLAATSLARRVAEELGLTFGVEVGYRIRGETVPGDHLSFVTAGYLLSWLTADPTSVEGMTHIICDEAHIRTADMELLLLTLRLVLRINPNLRVILMSATIEADFFGNYFAEFSEDGTTPPTPKYVGNRLFDVEVFHLDELSEGKAPGGRTLPQNLQCRTAKITKKFFPDELVESCQGKGMEVPLESSFAPKVQPPCRELVQELIPQVAEGGSTILVFVPGYADLLRMHSWLYWNLPTVGSVNMGYVPPKPDQLPEDEEEEEEEDFEEIREMEKMEGPFAKPMSASSAAFNKMEGPTPGSSLRYRLFALHSQVAQEDQELVLEKPPSNVCNVVLATTIAESSLTLPQVIGVIDFCIHKTAVGDPSQMGLARLMAQWCASSACLQREGRAGRTQPGWCIRMVPRLFFKECMLQYDIPEILRTPLTTLYLKSKGIADGMSQVVADNPDLKDKLSLGTGSPGELLAELLAPPGDEAINAAVHKLAQLAVLTEESPDAKVTVLGRLALFLPLDVQHCRLVWLGCLMGCPAEAIVLAAACSTPSPFLNPSRLGFQDQDEFTMHLRDTAEAWRFFDGGHASEPITGLRLFFAWLRRLKLTPARSNTPARWFRATAMLEKDAAIDSSKMTAFVSYIADLTIRCRDLCSDSRDEETACNVRKDLYGLVKLLRRPDKNRDAQKKLTDDSYVPAIGDVFRASASKIYALLAAAFSDTLLFGTHRLSGQEALIEALNELEPSGATSQDAVLIPQPQGRKRSDKKLAAIIETVSGFKPSQVLSNNSRFIAVSFPPEEEEEATTPWVSRRHDTRTMGLGPAETPRMRGLSLAPRLCHMAAGGPRRFNVGELEFARAVSPYEVEFTIMHEARGTRHIMPGLFGEQSSLGFPCHVTDPSRLAKDHFACVASEMTLVESGTAARVNNATLLEPEQMVFVLTTICPSSISLELGFSQGPGGSADGARAALTGLRFKFGRRTDIRKLIFERNLPALKVLGKVNAIRAAILENLVSAAEANSAGQEILLWQDEEAQEDFEDLLRMINEAPTIEEIGGAYGAQAEPVKWVIHRQHLSMDESKKPEEEEPSDEDDNEDDEEEDGDEADEDADVRALQPIVIRPRIENQVAMITAKESPPITHSFECPDCADRFQDWESCREHLVHTGHLDVSTPQAEKQARALCKPVRWRCPECFEGFNKVSELEEHLATTNHLAFTSGMARTNLCRPRPIPGLDDALTVLESRLEDIVQTQEEKADVSDADAQEEKSFGFFRSLRTTLSAPSSIPARQELLPEYEALCRDLDLDKAALLKLQELDIEEARDIIGQMKRNKVPIKNKNGWIMSAVGRMLNMAPQKALELLPEYEELCRELDLDRSAIHKLQELDIDQAREIIEQMTRNPVPVRNRTAWLTGAVARRSNSFARRLNSSAPQAERRLGPLKHPDATAELAIARLGLDRQACDALRRLEKADVLAICTQASRKGSPQKRNRLVLREAKKVAASGKAKEAKKADASGKEKAKEAKKADASGKEKAKVEKIAAEKPDVKEKKSVDSKPKAKRKQAETLKAPPLPPMAAVSLPSHPTPASKVIEVLQEAEEPPSKKAKKATEQKTTPEKLQVAGRNPQNEAKDFVAKLKQASSEQQILAVVKEEADVFRDPKSILNLALQRLKGSMRNLARYTCQGREAPFEATLSLQVSQDKKEGPLKYVAKGATKKEAEGSAARAALRSFEQVLERCREKVES